MRYRIGMLCVLVLCLAASIVSIIWLLVAAVAGSHRAWRIAIGFDQLANVTLGGSEDCTISSRCWMFRAEQPYMILRLLIDKAFAVAGFSDHCETAYQVEKSFHERAFHHD